MECNFCRKIKSKMISFCLTYFFAETSNQKWLFKKCNFLQKNQRWIFLIQTSVYCQTAPVSLCPDPLKPVSMRLPGSPAGWEDSVWQSVASAAWIQKNALSCRSERTDATICSALWFLAVSALMFWCIWTRKSAVCVAEAVCALHRFLLEKRRRVSVGSVAAGVTRFCSSFLQREEDSSYERSARPLSEAFQPFLILMEARGKYEFSATADDELSFRKGDILKVGAALEPEVLAQLLWT